MDPALKRLIKKMPPPEKVPNKDVDWSLLENGLGLKYPDAFKEFVGVYGSSVWCDHFSPFYDLGESEKGVKAFVKAVKGKLKPLSGNMFDEKHKAVVLPLFPDGAGLFPFMIDYSSSLYSWNTENKDPNKWPIVCWLTGQIVILEEMSISKLLLEWLEAKPALAKILGDASELPSERLKLS